MAGTGEKATSRSCVFCGGRPVEREHLIPEWVGKCFPHRGPYPHTKRAADEQGEQSKLYSAGVFRAKARIVCQPCNGGWMSDLENAVRPLLRWMMLTGQSCALGADDQRVLARWSLKTLMVLQCAQSGGKAALPQEQLRRLRAHSDPPEAFRVALAGRRRENPWPYRFYGLGVDLVINGRPLPPSPTSEFNAFLGAICIGHFVAHIVGQFTGERVDIGPTASDLFVDAWPISGRVTWPPPRLLPMTVLDRMFEPPRPEPPRSA